MFYSPELNKDLHYSSRTLKKRIRKQMENSEFNLSVEDSAENSLISMEILLIISLILNLFDRRAMMYMIALIRSLSVIIHLPLLRILIPSNVSLVFSIIIPIVMFDILDSDYSTELLLEFDYD